MIQALVGAVTVAGDKECLVASGVDFEEDTAQYLWPW